eukprot:TRINITY_DN2715_c0_g1_i1.p2 TRINITY_DN2715_c0_g1~~TRINITY_DN2715_c0_g1_i1.p2  ORF type:complete len:313 (-),score=144.95 TRINITY_DN2715_c0_g1_i1:123-1061(-)
METATAAGLALVQTQNAAVKEFQEYLEKRNVDLGKLRTQIAERDKALQQYDGAQYSLDELRKKPPKDASKMVAAEQKAELAKTEYDNVHRIISGELFALRDSKYSNFQLRYEEFVGAQISLFSGLRNAWQLLFAEDYPDTVAVPTPANILEKRRQWRDKSDKKAGKADAKALKARLAGVRGDGARRRERRAAAAARRTAHVRGVRAGRAAALLARTRRNAGGDGGRRRAAAASDARALSRRRAAARVASGGVCARRAQVQRRRSKLGRRRRAHQKAARRQRARQGQAAGAGPLLCGAGPHQRALCALQVCLL